jgi:tRNA modification GTPase
MMSANDTIAALATPVGTAAIAVVRVSGPACAELARAIFGDLPPARVARHADYRDRAGALVDDVLLTFFAGPQSYSGEDTLEISCHGNPFIAQKLLEDLFARGCRPAEPGEFTKRAFLSGRMDLSQAEAVMDLIGARSERALAAANRQLRGSLGRCMEDLVQGLVACLAAVEAYIDFPEEDLPPESRQALQERLSKLQQGTGRLLATSHYGEVLRSGLRTVIIGEPNAGKSSLLNRLVGRERAIVSAEPGTTRDYLEELISVGPHALRLIDTAGLNETPTPLERRGIDKTFEQASLADLFLWVIDSSVGRAPSGVPRALHGRMNANNTLVVMNKCDIEPSAALPDGGWVAVRVSALEGEGMDELVRLLVARAESFRSDVGEEIVAINARHADALTRAQQALAKAQEGLGRAMDNELIASDLREALSAFGEIAGRVDNERVLDELFANFCIGK